MARGTKSRSARSARSGTWMGMKAPIRLNGATSVFVILFMIVAFSSSDMKWLQYGPKLLN